MSDEYADYDQMEQVQDLPPAGGALALRPSRLAMTKAIADEFDLDAPQWRVLVEQTFPAAKTIEAVLMALSYCRARKLDIFKKPVHIVPMWSSALNKMVETVWPGIAEIRTTAARTGEYAGIDEVEFGPMLERDFTGTLDVWENRRKTSKSVTKKVRYPEWARVVVYRIVKGQKHAFHAKVFWDEMYAKMGRTEIPNEMWEKRSRGQLDKCVEAAALRKAFPEEVGSMYAAEEMEGRTIDVAPAAEPAKAEPPPVPEDSPQSPPAGDSAAPGDTSKSGAATITENATVADDFNDDDSGVTGSTEETTLEKLEFWCAGAKTVGEIDEAWRDLNIEAELLEGSPDRVEAERIKAKHVLRLSAPAEQQGDLLSPPEVPE